MSIILLAEVGKLKKDIGTYVRKDAAQRAFVFTLGVDSGALLEDWLQDAGNLSAFQAMCESITLMREVSYYPTAMDAVAASSTARTAINNSSIAFTVVSTSNTGIGKFVAGSVGLDPTLYADMDAVAASNTAMDAVVASQVAMDTVVAIQTAMDAVAASQVAMDTVVASQAAMETVFGSAVAKRAMFESQIAEVSIRSSSVAMNYADSIAVRVTDDVSTNQYGSPSPLTTEGKWFIVRCTDLYAAGTYNRGIRYYRHGQSWYAGTWDDYSFAQTGMHSPFNVAPTTDVGLDALYESLHGRFFTKIGVMTRDSTSTPRTQEYWYINMDAEGVA